jgi:hypothetical protein
MSAAPTTLRMIEVSGAEARWLLEGSCLARLVYVRRELTGVRPARHVWEYGRSIVRTPVPVPATCRVDAPAEAITYADEAVDFRRTLAGRSHGPHDTLLRPHPETVAGFRLAHAEA